MGSSAFTPSWGQLAEQLEIDVEQLPAAVFAGAAMTAFVAAGHLVRDGIEDVVKNFVGIRRGFAIQFLAAFDDDEVEPRAVELDVRAGEVFGAAVRREIARRRGDDRGQSRDLALKPTQIVLRVVTWHRCEESFPEASLTRACL